MFSFLTFLFPHERNNYHPHCLRHHSLGTYFVVLLTIQLVLNLFYSTDPKILGFASSIYYQEIIRLTNQERAKDGIAPLTENPTLNQAALLKARDMFTDDYWAHVAPDGISPWFWFEQSAYEYLMAGENLAKDFDTSRGVVSGWMASRTHRENILNENFTEIGVALMNGVLQGEETTLVVQFFGKPVPSMIAGGVTTEEFQRPSGGREAKKRGKPPQFLPAATNAVVAEGIMLKPVGVSVQALTGLAELKFRMGQVTSSSNWGLGQKIMVTALAFLIVLFVADSIILWRKGVLRQNSHSLLHALILGILLLGVVYSTSGLVL